MNKKICLFALIIIVVAFILFVLPLNTESYVKVASEPIEPLATLEPALVPVCSCESEQGKYGVPSQFLPDGSVRFGKINKLDTGMCQINQHYHLENAKKMGLDIFTEQGNIKYANYLYKKNGLRDWAWSKKCWQ